MQKRILAFTLAILFCFSLSATAHAEESPSLFAGDRVWQGDKLMPLLEVGEMHLVPIELLEQLADFHITVSETLGSALIERGEKWLSLNLNFGTCLDADGTVRQIQIYRYNEKLYVSADILCEIFDLTYESAYAADGYLSARLSDGSEELSFEELLSMYTSRPTIDTQISLKNIGYRTMNGTFMHPILLVPLAANIKTLLSLIGNHGTTFALSPADIEDYAEQIPAIYAAGHTVAYYMDASRMKNAAAVQTFREEMQSANEFLFSLVGATVRVYVSTERIDDIPDIRGYFKKSCRMNLVADDLASERIVNMTLSDSPRYEVFNFSLSSDYDTRQLYHSFFTKFDTYENLRAMPLNAAGAAQ